MTSQAIVAKSVLVTASIGSATPSSDWSIHVSKMPPTPHRAIAIHDTGGSENPNPKWLLDYRTFQVHVRGGVNDYAAAYDKIAAVKDVLLGITAFVHSGGDRWDGVTCIGDITFIGRDENDRPSLVLNFRAIIEPADNATTNREPL